MALVDLTKSSVETAIEEFDRLQRTAFLKRYGFKPSRGYVLEKNGRRYDSKAIAGAAHGYLPGKLPLRADEFSGGEATVKRVLEKLDFTIVGPDVGDLPSPGDVLNNEEIGRSFSVGNMGGMRRSKKRNLLVLISDAFKGLYQDRWEGDVLHYTGMGKTGEQDRGHSQNRTLAESRTSGISVHLVEALEAQKYTYAGEVELSSEPYQEEQPDDKGQNRMVWMFPLKLKAGGLIPTISEGQAHGIEQSQARLARRLSIRELISRARRARKQPAQRTANALVFVRDAAVAEYARRMANGTCDLCGQFAPFRNSQGEPYLECHHVTWLALGGEDSIANTVALCPNCHRRMHILNQSADRECLRARAAKRNSSLNANDSDSEVQIS